MRRFALLSILAISAAASAANTKTAAVKVTPTDPAPYASIISVSTGPAHSFSSAALRGKFERVIVVSGELAYDPPSLWLETLAYGDEACCPRVLSSYRLNISALRKKGFTLPDATTSELKIGRWISPSALEFRYGNLRCQLQGLGNPEVSVSCTTDG